MGVNNREGDDDMDNDEISQDKVISWWFPTFASFEKYEVRKDVNII